MKTVPTVRLADTSDAAGLPDLPEEIQLAMTDIAGAAREGLLAMSVAAGMAVMAGDVRGRDRRGVRAEGQARRRAGPRCATAPGVARSPWAGAGCAVARPRARTVDGHEVPLTSYAHFAADDMLTQVVMERMLAGVATRRHARTAEPVGEQVDQDGEIDVAARRSRAGSSSRPRPRWPS